MKQLLFLFVLVLVGYFVLWGGATRVLYNADMNPKTLVSNLVSGVEENFIPEIDSTRQGFRYTNATSYGQIKENVFITYDPDICFALVDLVYSSGASDSEFLIKQYLSMFTLPEDTTKILNLLKSYKDKQTLKILLSIYLSPDFDNPEMPKGTILNILSNYHLPEVAQIIKDATLSEDPILAQTAQVLDESLKDSKWYQEGLKTDLNNSNSGLDLKINLNFNKNHLGQQYHQGSDFENQMNQY